MFGIGVGELLAAVVILVVLIAIQGGVVPPMSRGQAVRTTSSCNDPKYSLRTLFIVMTLAAIGLGIGVWLAP